MVHRNSSFKYMPYKLQFSEQIYFKLIAEGEFKKKSARIETNSTSEESPKVECGLGTPGNLSERSSQFSKRRYNKTVLLK